jgi:SAM-dependent methyltransferase
MELSHGAVEYITRDLKLDAYTGSFPDNAYWKENSFDIITMWYVIEHFTDINSVLLKVKSLLAPGGIFAFSTPSAGGISAKLSKNNFLKNSPADHFTIWNPSRIKNTLRHFGFTVEKIIITGHHPERFPKWTRFIGAKTLRRLSELLSLGDTFECYASNSQFGN